MISAEYTSYYASAKREATAVTGTKNLVVHGFTVGTGGSSTSYFDPCTFYPSHCTFTTTRDTGIFSEPRTAKTGNTSVQLEAAPNGTTYTSIGLYVNSGSNIFYQVLTSDGLEGYIYSGYTEIGKKVYEDIKLSSASYPNGHVKGNVFAVTGTISSTYNVLGTATVYIYSGFGVSGNPVTGGSGSVSNNKYVLNNSAIDDATAFNTLANGKYTYRIQVTFSSYYAQDAKTLGTFTGTRTLKTHYFTVIPSAVSQSSCSHSNSTTVVEAATCTDTGTQVTSCSKCGLTEKATIEKTGHTYGSYVVTKPATCTEAGSQEKTCTACGKVYTKEIPASHTYGDASCSNPATCTICGVTTGSALGHNYDKSVVTKPTCTTDGYTTHTCSRCGDSYNDTIVTATGHSYNAATCTTPKTCKTCGKASGSALGHKWQEATCTEPMTCSTCGTTSGEANGHDWSAATCTDPMTCSACGTTSGTANGHDWKSANCTTPKTCKTCGKTTGSPLGHKWQEATCTKPMTCSTCGTTSGEANGHDWTSATCTAPRTCTTCGATTGSANGHNWKDATCTKPMTCSACGTTSGNALGHSWKDATCTKPKTCSVCGTTEGSALDHDYDSVVTAPSCLTDGYTTHTCKRCDDSYTDSIVSALGHSYSTATCTAPRTCKVCGMTTGSALGHDWKDATCTNPMTCTTCGTTSGEALGHQWKAATCTTAKTCTTCGTTEGSALGHSYKKVVTAPTCTTDGYTTNTCSSCGHSYVSDEIAATGHNYVAGTCTACGDAMDFYLFGWINGGNYACEENSSDLGEYKFVNGKLVATFKENSYIAVKTSDNEHWYMFPSYNETTSGSLYRTTDGAYEKMFIPGGAEITFTLTAGEGDSLNLSYEITNCPHNWGEGEITQDPTCTEDGVRTFTCSICGESKTETVSAIGHSYDSVVTMPTCTEDGFTTHTCTVCKDSYVDAKTDALGHKYQSVTEDATCTEDGRITYTCDHCGDSYFESISAEGHKYESVVTAPSCTEEGYTTHTCSVCGYSYEDARIDALGHNYEAVVTAPTCTNAGFTTHTCSVCKDSYVDSSVDALGHSYNSVVTKPTCTEDGYTTHTCSACGHSYVDAETDALGHTPGEPHSEVIVDSDCVTAGLCKVTVSCTLCGTIISSSIDELPLLPHVYESVITAPTCTKEGFTTYTCSLCGHSYSDDQVPATGHSFSEGSCTICGDADPDYNLTAPTLTLSGAGLAFKEEIHYNVYFMIDNPENVEIEEIGIVSWTTPIDGTIETAEFKSAGSEPYSNYLKARSNPIPAKNMSEDLYMKVYAKMSNGTYVYSQLFSYSAKTYTMNMMAKESTSNGLKALCVALMNYGATAQQYFDYKTDELMNADISPEDQALVNEYHDTMIPNLIQPGTKDDGLVANCGFKSVAPSVNFGGALGINFAVYPTKTVDSDVKMYIWTEEELNANETLTLENAKEVVTMNDYGSVFTGRVAGISAKNAGSTIYICAVYTSNGVQYRSGVITYSVATYCQTYANKAGDEFQNMASLAAVYTHYADAYLNK